MDTSELRHRSSRLLQRVHDQELIILVWGPGESGDSAEYAKREQLRTRLRETFPRSSVYFSEDKELDEALPPEFRALPLVDKELAHLALCHLCVVLDTSAGPAAEIAAYGRTQFASRLLILTPDRHKSVTSFPALLRENLNQVFFSPDEFESCNLIERALTRARQVSLNLLAFSQAS